MAVMSASLLSTLTAATAADRSAIMSEIKQALPEGGRVWLVDPANPEADDNTAGTAAAPLRTIQAAAEQAGAGDLVLVGGGTYRERVAPAHGGTPEAPILYQAVPGERVEVKGSELWVGPWDVDAENDRVFSSPIPEEKFAEIPNPYRIGISIASRDQQSRSTSLTHQRKDSPCRPHDNRKEI